MGSLNVKLVSSQKQLNDFTRLMLQDIQALQRMLEEGWFETDTIRIGAEQELCLVDEHFKPAKRSMEILEALNDPDFTTELAQFNIETNLPPYVFTGDCFSQMENRLEEKLNKLEAILEPENLKYVLTGILPTIRKFDLGLDSVTPLQRYFALMEAVKKMRGDRYELRVSGVDELNIMQDSAMLEACNTSFQVHLQVTPDTFVDKYNAAQFLTAPVMALSVNSPLLFGKRLWSATRIALFQQSIDTRNSSEHLRERSPRVMFGNRWVENSVLELFQEDITRFRIMLTADIEHNAMEMVANGDTPKLQALTTHNSTIYRWNRPCYGISDNGKPHLRIENRVFGAGPTVLDEMANAAFWLGLTDRLPEVYPNLTEDIDFMSVRSNFVAVSQLGMDTELNWIKGSKYSVQEVVQKELLPIAREGLAARGVKREDIDRYLGVIEQRNEKKITGASWMVNSFTRLKKHVGREEIGVALTASMVRQNATGRPIHTWELAGMQDVANYRAESLVVEEFMTRDLFTVHEDDIPELAADIMDWQKVRHVPVEDGEGKLVGLVSSRTLLRHLLGVCREQRPKDMRVKDIMIADPVTIHPEALITEAMKVMRKHKHSCLPVIKGDRLVGIITENNFLNITSSLLTMLDRIPEEDHA
ncbi:MAG TPA: CBS domain-containing protein [Cytophagales bacterium]|nr:CBS domain-containing protein [Cytophagales bacterium]HAP58555.1 CBS domain-containing protein [Cytophagales bacterium]